MTTPVPRRLALLTPYDMSQMLKLRRDRRAPVWLLALQAGLVVLFALLTQYDDAATPRSRERDASFDGYYPSKQPASMLQAAWTTAGRDGGSHLLCVRPRLGCQRKVSPTSLVLIFFGVVFEWACAV